MKLPAPLFLLVFLSSASLVLAQDDAPDGLTETNLDGSPAKEAPNPDAALIPQGEPTNAEQLLALWLGSYTGLETLQVSFTQERKLKTIKLPIRSSGKLWMETGSGRFRWQVGDPPKTVVTGDGDQIKIAHTRRQKVEYRKSGGDADAPGFSMIAGGFPRTVSGFLKEYRILKAEKHSEFFELHTRPLRGESAQAVETMVYLIDLDDYFLRGFDISLRDGSEVRSEFHDVRRNPSIPASQYQFDTSGYEVSEGEDA